MSAPAVTPVQLAVLAAVAEHERSSFSPATADAWWRCGPPFEGMGPAFGAHLRSLARKGLLHREQGGFRLTTSGRDLAAYIDTEGSRA